MPTKITILIFAPPILAIIYRWLEHIGLIDRVTGRALAIEGLKRLRSTAGYPVSWIYNKDDDTKIFAALERRISKKTEMPKIQKAISDGYRPSLISTAGKAVEIDGVPSDWPQEEKHSYLPNQPILYVFDVPESKTGQKGDKACNLEQLESWLKEEKESRQFWLGVLALGLISMALISLRLISVS